VRAHRRHPAGRGARRVLRRLGGGGAGAGAQLERRPGGGDPGRRRHPYRPAAGHHALGVGPVLVGGSERRPTSHQRPGRGHPRQGGVRRFAGTPPLPGGGRRVLRVAPARRWAEAAVPARAGRRLGGPVRPGRHRDQWDEWLDPDNHDVAGLVDLLEAPATVGLRARPVGTRVNNARNDGPDLVEVLTGEVQPQLL
jgi:hypothetical protein